MDRRLETLEERVNHQNGIPIRDNDIIYCNGIWNVSPVQRRPEDMAEYKFQNWNT